MPLKITISGPAGSGKSSLVQAIVQKYGMQTADIGQVFRQRAVQKGLTIAEYDRLVEQNPQEDMEMDKDFQSIVQSCPEDIIVSRRMGFYFLPEAFSLWLDVDPLEGAQRVFLADRGSQEQKYTSVQEALEKNQERMQRVQQRLKKLYGIDFMDKCHYDYILDTSNKTFEENFNLLDALIQSLRE